ncbi:MAG: hypothetical protein Q8S00_12895, partial [Deltaproteobacteria bacterium]|nr:hypothetical protein [Deltaproteobacteria bacterium]
KIWSWQTLQGEPESSLSGVTGVQHTHPIILYLTLIRRKGGLRPPKTANRVPLHRPIPPSEKFHVQSKISFGQKLLNLGKSDTAASPDIAIKKKGADAGRRAIDLSSGRH